jgi:V-type H+-transporting ATPase subunit a
MFKSDVSGMLRGEGWVIAESVDEVRATVNKSHANMDMAMPSLVDHVPKPWPTPPTHFTTNKFTYGYQEFVNTYGIPRYREANPALFTAATFPFLFGVMYGDIGHGLFLFSAGLYLLWNEKANDNAKLGEMGAGMHAGRYMITMMGFFAIYAGFVYNDCFSLGLNLFGSRWYFYGQDKLEVQNGAEAVQTAPYGNPASVYPFGLDPIWHVASNELLFFNSFKMKLSVILGIIQMFMGTCLKGINAIFFSEKLDLLFEVIPMILFAASLFVYMIFLIVMKWSINWNSRMLSATCLDPQGDTWGSSDYDGEWIMCDEAGNGGYCTPWGYSCTGYDDTATKCPLNFGGSGDGCQPPNLITTLINIALQPGNVDEPLYQGQAGVQKILLLLAVVSVPVLLLAKPYFLSQKAAHHHGEEGGDHEEHGFGEILIHQAIETIEFVLGMVSNTASYLRLWALSLAHSELASVFWGKAMLTTLNMNWFASYIGFGIFAGVTFAVLLMMDVLECFLHALRLHWVEFQNKFFKADGVRFAPYSFKSILADANVGG